MYICETDYKVKEGQGLEGWRAGAGCWGGRDGGEDKGGGLNGFGGVQGTGAPASIQAHQAPPVHTALALCVVLHLVEAVRGQVRGVNQDVQVANVAHLKMGRPRQLSNR